MRSTLSLLISIAALVTACETKQQRVSVEPETAPVTAKVISSDIDSDATEVPVEANKAPTSTAVAAVDGNAVYSTNCQMCHQASGAGLPNAFPPLKGSSIVNNPDATQIVNIILHGYNARPEYGAMPGYGANLTDEKVAAVATHVRSTWGNSAPPVTADFVQKLRKISQPATL